MSNQTSQGLGLVFVGITLIISMVIGSPTVISQTQGQMTQEVRFAPPRVCPKPTPAQVLAQHKESVSKGIKNSGWKAISSSKIGSLATNSIRNLRTAFVGSGLHSFLFGKIELVKTIHWTLGASGSYNAKTITARINDIR